MKLNHRYDDFVEHVCELLGPLGTIRPKRMFGGWCIYVDEMPTGLIQDDTLWFKVDEGNRADYEAAGTGQFKPFPDKEMVMSYWQVPESVMDDRRAMVDWGRKAYEAAVRSAGKTKGRRVRRR
ncbi:MAG: TfoX/Sxy family protein [Burkholderiales bacterium]|nr:TfoX/Sxy family protein [Burkholderiales bacterium]